MAKALAGAIPSDDAFRNAFAVANVSKPALARYYLRAIEDQLAGESDAERVAQPDAEKVNLEHVLPLNPAAGWGVSRGEAESLHNRIGNLALLPKPVNAGIGNGTLEEKRAAFAASAFEFTRRIAEESGWGEAEIDRRQAALADEAVKTWPLRVW